MSQARAGRANLLSPILAVTAILGSAVGFAYVVVATLGPLG
jgi:hypothetical protein